MSKAAVWMIGCVVLLGVAMAVVDRVLPAPTPAASSSPVAPPSPVAVTSALPPADGGSLMGMSPMELNWVLIRMVGQPGLALKGKQRDGIVKILEDDRKLVREMNPLWTEYESWVRKSLTVRQKQTIAKFLHKMTQGLQRPGGGPMHEQLFVLLEKRSGVAFLDTDLEDLVGDAQAIPFADPTPEANSLNPEDFAYGILVLEDDAALRITKPQAVQVLPYVKLQNDLYQAHQREKAAIVALLTDAQKRFAEGARGTYPNGVPPAATVDELLAAIQARR